MIRADLRRLIVLALLLLALPLSTIAQDATPVPPPLDLSTQAGLIAYQALQEQATAEDVGLPEGFELELVAGALSFPSAVAVADDGTVFAALSGFAGTPGQVVLVNPDGTTTVVVDAATAGLTGPITDITFGPDGAFYVAFAGGIAVVDLAAGLVTPIVTGLPSLGDHQNNQLAFSEDGWLYFGQGTVTNSMVVGPDNATLGWLPLFPGISDVPCEDVVLAGSPFESPNVLTPGDPNDVALTSPFHPFGVAVDPGTVVAGAVPCTGALLRFQPEDPVGTLEVFAWGFRNPYGVTIDEEGAIWVVENGPDVRGSRPIANAPDSIWRLTEEDAGSWYGYPDFVAGVPVTDEGYRPPGDSPLAFVIDNHADLLDGRDAPPEPDATLAPNTATGQAEIGPEEWGEMEGNLFVASHGDFGPVTGALEHQGHAVYHVDPESGEVDTLLQNPAPHEATGAPSRPVGLDFAPDGSLYVADLGIIETSTAGLLPRPNTGAIWRVIPAEEEAIADADEDEASPAAAGEGETVQVSLTEFAIDMPTELPAGPITFEITNDGGTEHSFEIESEELGVEEGLEEGLEPEDSATLEVDLEPGTYEAYCPVGNHADMGMTLEVTVTEE